MHFSKMHSDPSIRPQHSQSSGRDDAIPAHPQEGAYRRQRYIAERQGHSRPGWKLIPPLRWPLMSNHGYTSQRERNPVAVMAGVVAFLFVFAIQFYTAWQLVPWESFSSSTGEPSDAQKLVLITGFIIPVIAFFLAIVAVAFIVAISSAVAFLAHGVFDHPPLDRWKLFLGLPALGMLGFCLFLFASRG